MRIIMDVNLHSDRVMVESYDKADQVITEIAVF